MIAHRQPRVRNRLWYVLAFIATIALGLASRHFPNLVPAFLGKYPGDALWALMVFWGFGLILPTISSIRLAGCALDVSYAVELLKLSQTPWLAHIRHTTFGHLMFGHVFSWQNLVAYTAGVAVGAVLESVVFSANSKTFKLGETTSPRDATTSFHQANTSMIRHTVVLKLKHASGTALETDFLMAASRLAAIATVRSFECLRQVSAKNDFTFGLSMEFSSEEDYRFYNEHPDHVHFVQTRWMLEVEKFMEIDYVPMRITLDNPLT